MKIQVATFAEISLLGCLFLQACGGSPANQAESSPVPTLPATLQAIATSTSTLPAIPTLSPTPLPSQTPIKHISQPGTPSYINLQLTQDCTMVDSTGTPIQPLRLFPVCDLWKVNLVERPFTADLKTYLPYLDIQETQFGANVNWIFARIHPVNVIPLQGTSDLYYMLELDLNLDGLSDMIIAAQNLGLSDFVWTTVNVRAWSYLDGNVNIVFDQGAGSDSDLVWVRRTPAKDIEFAFKPALLGGDTSFAWSVWAYQGTLDAAQFIPINTLPDAYQIDNTCSLGFNSDASGLPNHCVRE